MGEPQAKKAKNDGASGVSEKTTKAIEEVQRKVEREILQHQAAVAELEKQMAAKLKPLHAERDALLAAIPRFWLTAMRNHDLLAELISERDEAVLAHLTALSVELFDNDVSKGYTLTLTFEANPFFANKTLYKTIRDPMTNPIVESSEIEWKEGKNYTQEPPPAPPADAKKRKAPPAQPAEESFFSWFSPEDQDTEVARIFVEDLYDNAWQYYNDDVASDDESEEGDDE